MENPLELTICFFLSVGYHSVIDPGPPPVQYSCQASPYNPSPYHGGPSSEAQLLQSTPSPSSTRILTESSSAPPLVIASPNPAVHATSASETGGSLSPTTLSITDPGVPGATGSPTVMPTAPGDQVSSSAKIAIGVCSVIGLAAAIGLLLFLLHRRRRRGGNGQMKSRIWVNRGFPKAGSPTPLIPATRRSKGVLAFPKPPPQLRDRRFLPSILRPGARSPSPPLTPLTPAYAHCNPVFPPSPICSPTANKLVPRHERTPKMYGMVSRPPPTLSYGSSTVSGAHRRSQSSYTASSMTANSFRNDGSTMGTGTPPASLPRPPRPHEAPLEIPDLVRPGPPPSFGVASGRALSPAPLSGPRPPGPTSVPSSAQGNDLPKNAQEIVDLTNEYAREVRGSWGSWSGVGGGGTGTTPSSSKKRAVSIKDADGNTARPATAGATIAATAVLTEQELESIGGKY